MTPATRATRPPRAASPEEPFGVPEVTAHRLARGTWRYSRASGPGGQHRDHAETRAVLHVPRAALEGLPADVAERLGAELGLARRAVRLTSQAERSRERNRALVEERLAARVAAALAPRRPRRPPRPPAAGAERRRPAKARRAAAQVARRPPVAGEDCPPTRRTTVDAIDAIRLRRSVRRYTDRPVDDADLDELLRLALLAPTGSMAQAWTLVVVRERERARAVGELVIEGG